MFNRRIILAAMLGLVARPAMAMPELKLASFSSRPSYVLPRPPFGIRAAQRAAGKTRNRARNKHAHRGGRHD